MVKVLSQSGNSLADMYDAEGSIAGIEQLETRELPIVHEMGHTLFSERYSSFIRVAESAAIPQSVAFDVVLSDLPAGPFRIFGIAVSGTPASRVALASVAVRDPGNGREIPIWMFDSSSDVEIGVRYSDDGAAVATRNFLRPVQLLEAIPHTQTGVGQPQSVRDIAFRGQSSAFGAGTVVVQALIHLGFSQVGGLSSRGLPVPSW